MLEGMRRHANSFITSVLFGIIIIVFIFSFGPGSARYCGSALPTAASVNGRAITAAEFQQQYARTFERMQQFRPNYNVDTARAENLKKTVVDQLIGRELLVQAGLRRGLVIPDEELAREIVAMPMFQKDGAFDRELYRRYATSLNLSEAGFEDELRRDLLAQRMREILQDTVAVSEAEIRGLWERRNNRADLWFVKVDPFAFRSEVQVSNDEVKAFATAQRARVEDHYNQHANRYNKPERVRARHILIKVGEDAPEAEVAKARQRIDEARQRIDGGEDFAAVARAVSEDSSAAQGGDLGAQPRGSWVKPFEDAAFALEPGAMSEVVRTQFGFHLIKLDSKIAAETKTVDDVADEIARELVLEDRTKEKARAVAAEWLTRLKETADPESLNPPTSDEQKPDPFAPRVDSTGSFEKDSRYVPKIGLAGEVAAQAFALTAEAPTPAGPVEVGGRFYAIKLKDRQMPDPASFDADKERLRSELTSRRQMGVVEDFIKTLREQARVDVNPSLVSYDEATPAS